MAKKNSRPATPGRAANASSVSETLRSASRTPWKICDAIPDNQFGLSDVAVGVVADGVDALAGSWLDNNWG